MCVHAKSATRVTKVGNQPFHFTLRLSPLAVKQSRPVFDRTPTEMKMVSAVPVPPSYRDCPMYMHQQNDNLTRVTRLVPLVPLVL
jgi:hypothetical protein